MVSQAISSEGGKGLRNGDITRGGSAAAATVSRSAAPWVLRQSTREIVDWRERLLLIVRSVPKVHRQPSVFVDCGNDEGEVDVSGRDTMPVHGGGR